MFLHHLVRNTLSCYKYSVISNRHLHRSVCRLPVNCSSFVSEGKGRAIPVQVLTFPEGSRRLRLQDFKTIGTRKWQDCQPSLPPRKYSGTDWVDPRAIVRLEGLSMKNSSDNIENRNRDLLACSAVPQPTAPSRAQFVSEFNQNVQVATAITSILQYKIPRESVPFNLPNKDKWTDRHDEDWHEVLKRHWESKWILFCEEKYLRNTSSWEWFLDK